MSIVVQSVNGRVPYIKDFFFIQNQGSRMIFEPVEVAKNRFRNVPGQITRNSTMGRLLYELASSGPKDWLEIGSWNGLGSTQCILDGFKNRTDDPHLDSFELDPVMFQIAEENLKDHPCIKNVTFHCNALGHAHRQPFPSEESLSKEERECPHFRIHYEREWALYEQATGVIPAVAPEVAVLDGGEYSGYLDWVHLDKTRLHYLILDDTNALKNQRVMAELDPTEWKCLAKENERNGWAAFQRIF